ncbi:MAG: SDR family NAD(P)-dependent oxidoreductase, partial [Myxococcota bacterium]
VARDGAALRASLEPLVADGLNVFAIAADVADADRADPLIAEAVAKAGPIDVLINNASTLGPVPLPLLLDLSPSALAHTFAVNTIGPHALTRAVAGNMVLRGQGLILNISSDAAVNHYENWGGYAASKAALDHLSATLSAELDGTGVRVLAIDPGEMNTQMHSDALPDADPSTLADPAEVAHRIATLAESAPSGRHLAEGVRS